jgi:hypothetical protein
VLARQALGRDAGIALAELDGQPLLLGFGSAGVQLLSSGASAGRPRHPAPAQEVQP